MSPNGNFFMGYNDYNWHMDHYAHDGTHINHIDDSWNNNQYNVVCIFTTGPNGDYDNDHCYIHFLIGDTDATHLWGRRDQLGFSDGSYWRILYYHGPAPIPGWDEIWGDWVVAAVDDQVGDYIWVVEKTDCVAARWEIPGPGWNATGEYFGESMTPGDADNLINDPVDIARDNQNHYYVLDHLSTDAYTIKSWSYSAGGTSPYGSFGDSSDWDLMPIHMDGNDYNGNLAVLHTTGENAMISIFTEDETPG